MAKLFKWVGGIWAVLGILNVVLPREHNSDDARILSLILNMLIFVFPGLVLLGIGYLIDKKSSSIWDIDASDYGKGSFRPRGYLAALGVVLLTSVPISVLLGPIVFKVSFSIVAMIFERIFGVTDHPTTPPSIEQLLIMGILFSLFFAFYVQDKTISVRYKDKQEFLGRLSALLNDLGCSLETKRGNLLIFRTGSPYAFIRRSPFNKLISFISGRIAVQAGSNSVNITGPRVFFQKNKKFKKFLESISSEWGNDSQRSDSETAILSPYAAKPSVETRLLELKVLCDKDLITQEEYAKKRAEILDKLTTALIICPGCGKDVSALVPYCPHCGKLTASASGPTPADKEQFSEEGQSLLSLRDWNEEKAQAAKVKGQKRNKGWLIMLSVFLGLCILKVTLPNESHQERFSQQSSLSSSPSSSSSVPLPSNDTPTKEMKETAEVFDRLQKLVRYKDLQILDSSWSISDFSIVTWKVKLKNTSKSTAFKDIHFATSYYAPSGTQVDRSIFGHTAYITIKPGQTKTIEFTEFAHSQANKASIMVDNAITIVSSK